MLSIVMPSVLPRRPHPSSSEDQIDGYQKYSQHYNRHYHWKNPHAVHPKVFRPHCFILSSLAFLQFALLFEPCDTCLKHYIWPCIIPLPERRSFSPQRNNQTKERFL